MIQTQLNRKVYDVPTFAKGTMLTDVQPHFIADAKRDLPPVPGFFISDRDEKRYAGFLRGLNPDDLPRDYKEYLALSQLNRRRELGYDQIKRLNQITRAFPKYRVIVRGISRYTDKLGNIIAYLEERVEINDGVHVRIDGVSSKGGMHAQFLNYNGDKWRYGVFVDGNVVKQGEEEIGINSGNCVFGIVTGIDERQFNFNLMPVEIVDKQRFRLEKNRIVRVKN